MLDQPVPNPLAKNPNVHTHKVFAAVGLILIGTIIAIAGIWYYVDSQSGTVDEVTDTNSSTNSAKSETSDWKSITEEVGVDYGGTYKYTFSYPQDFSVIKPTEAYSIVTNDPDKFQGGHLAAGYIVANVTASQPLAAWKQSETTFAGQKGYKGTLVTDGLSSSYYSLDSITTKEGTSKGFTFTCEIGFDGTMDITSQKETCDTIASTFKFL